MRNYDVIAGHYRASDHGDLNGMLAPLTGDSTWTEMAGFPYAGTYRGPQAVRDGVFQRIGDEWEDYRFVLDELHESGDVVIAIGSYSGVFKATGRSMRARVVHVWRLQDGAVTSFEQFTDTAQVRDAMN